MKTARRRLTIGLALLVAVLASVLYCVVPKQSSGDTETYTSKQPDPSCRVVLFSPDERLRRLEAQAQAIKAIQASQQHSLGGIVLIEQVWRKDPALANNPILIQDEMAVVRFRNRKTAPLTLYVIRSLDLKPWGSFYSTQGGLVLSEPRQVPRLTPEQAMVVSVEVRDDRGHLMEPVQVRPSLISYFYSPPKVPSAADIRKFQLPEIALQPGEEVDVSFPLFGDVFRTDCWFRPGTYTIHVSLSWAEASSGETKSMTADPVTVCITPEHVKAAETYRDVFYAP